MADKLKIREIKMPTSQYNIKCPYAMTPQFIVVHNTANDASAENEIKYMQSNKNEVSFHYAVDDKETVLGVPLNRNAWHAGDGCGYTICHSRQRSRRTDSNDSGSVI